MRLSILHGISGFEQFLECGSSLPLWRKPACWRELCAKSKFRRASSPKGKRQRAAALQNSIRDFFAASDWTRIGLSSRMPSQSNPNPAANVGVGRPGGQVSSNTGSGSCPNFRCSAGLQPGTGVSTFVPHKMPSYWQVNAGLKPGTCRRIGRSMPG